MLKKIIFITLLLTTSIFATEINWAKDYKAGLEEAQKLNKPVLFVSSRHSCKY